MTTKEFKANCIKMYLSSGLEIITEGSSTTFEKFNPDFEIDNSFETYNINNIKNAVGYYNKYNIIFEPDLFLSDTNNNEYNEDKYYLNNGKVPPAFYYNINSLRFLNYDIDIKILIGYFYSHYKYLNQLYSNNITDEKILYYFNIRIPDFVYSLDNNIFYDTFKDDIIDESVFDEDIFDGNVFDEEMEPVYLKVDKQYIYKKYKRYLNRKHYTFIFRSEINNEDKKNIIRKVYQIIKNKTILDFLYKKIMDNNDFLNNTNTFKILKEEEKIIEIKKLLKNKEVKMPYYFSSEGNLSEEENINYIKGLLDNYDEQFFRMTETDKLEHIKALAKNPKVKIPYEFNMTTIHTFTFDNFISKYPDCNTYTTGYTQKFLMDNKIMLSNIDYEIVMKSIRTLIRQEKYIKGKTDEICKYLKISKNTFYKILDLYGLEKPYQILKEDNKDEEMKEYCLKMGYSLDHFNVGENMVVPLIYKKLNNDYESKDFDGQLVEGANFLIADSKKVYEWDETDEEFFNSL